MSTVRLRMWGSLREATGTRSAEVSASTLAEALHEIRRRYPSRRVAAILDVCSVMVDEKPVHGDDPGAVTLGDAAVVDLLPPFAGG